MYFLLLSLFSLLETLWWWIIWCYPIGPLNYLHFVKTLFILLLCLGEIHSLSVPDPFCCFFWCPVSPSSVLFHCIYSSMTCLQYFLMFSFCWGSHCVHPFFTRIIMIIILNSLSRIRFSSKGLLCPLIWKILFYFFTVPDSPYFFPVY